MRKLLLSVVLMLVTLTTFGQGKEKIMHFSKSTIEMEGVEDDMWVDMKCTLTLYPKGENTVIFAGDVGSDTFKIDSVEWKVKDEKGRKRDVYRVSSPNGTKTIIYVYKKRKHGVKIYLNLMNMTMCLKK